MSNGMETKWRGSFQQRIGATRVQEIYSIEQAANKKTSKKSLSTLFNLSSKLILDSYTYKVRTTNFFSTCRETTDKTPSQVRPTHLPPPTFGTMDAKKAVKNQDF